MRKDYRAPQLEMPRKRDSVDECDVKTPLGNPSEVRVLRLSKWLGKGIDEWVWMASQVLRELFAAGQSSVATITGYGTVGFPAFFRFLLETGQPKHPDDFSAPSLFRHKGWRLRSARRSASL